MSSGLLPDDATFELSLGHWYSGPADLPIDRVTSPPPHAGRGALRVTYVGGTPNPAAAPELGSGNSTDFYYVVPGDVITVSAWLRSDPANTYMTEYSVILELQAKNAAGGFLAAYDSTANMLAESVWRETSLVATMPPAAKWVDLQVQISGPPSHGYFLAEGDRFYLSDVSANLRLTVPPAQSTAGIRAVRLYRQADVGR